MSEVLSIDDRVYDACSNAGHKQVFVDYGC